MKAGNDAVEISDEVARGLRAIRAGPVLSGLKALPLRTELVWAVRMVGDAPARTS
jgi:hypothetical protein